MTAGVAPDLALAPALVAARGLRLGRPMQMQVCVESTNDEAKAAARGGAAHGATWVAESQTAGRGRQGRAWLSPPGENLLFSVLVRAPIAPHRVPQTALAAGLAVHAAVAVASTPARVRIKWPNDVLVDDKKIAGILVEAVTTGSRVDALVVGVGINVHTRTFPETIADRATSVDLVSGATADRAKILVDVLDELDRNLEVVVGRGLAPLRGRLEAADALRGKRVRSDGGEEGVASGIDDEGRLIVRIGGRIGGNGRTDEASFVRWTAGEVHLLATSP